jgi:hypothetical protein
MKWSIFAIVATVSLLAISVAFAAAQMYNYAGYFGPTDNTLREKMIQEMNEVSDLQQEYRSGQITQEQYQQGLQEHWLDMAQIHQEYGYGCPMLGAGTQTPVPAGPGMMGYGMMW